MWRYHLEPWGANWRCLCVHISDWGLALPTCLLVLPLTFEHPPTSIHTEVNPYTHPVLSTPSWLHSCSSSAGDITIRLCLLNQMSISLGVLAMLWSEKVGYLSFALILGYLSTFYFREKTSCLFHVK